MKDSKTISTEWHELKHAAEYLEVKEWQVLRAIQESGTNDRNKVYAWILTFRPDENETPTTQTKETDNRNYSDSSVESE